MGTEQKNWQMKHSCSPNTCGFLQYRDTNVPFGQHGFRALLGTDHLLHGITAAASDALNDVCLALHHRVPLV